MKHVGGAKRPNTQVGIKRHKPLFSARRLLITHLPYMHRV